MSEMAFVAMCTSFFPTCNSDTRKDARTHTTFLTEFEPAWHFTLVQIAFLFFTWSLWGFCPSPSVSFAVAREDDRPFRLWPFPLFPVTSRSWLKLHEYTLPLSSQCGLSFLSDSWRLILFPQHLPEPEVSSSHYLIDMKFLQLSSIDDRLAPSFAPFLDHTKLSQSGVEQNFPILTCTILPGSYLKVLRSRILKHDPTWRRNPGRRYSVNS